MLRRKGILLISERLDIVVKLLKGRINHEQESISTDMDSFSYIFYVLSLSLTNQTSQHSIGHNIHNNCRNNDSD